MKFDRFSWMSLMVVFGSGSVEVVVPGLNFCWLFISAFFFLNGDLKGFEWVFGFSPFRAQKTTPKLRDDAGLSQSFAILGGSFLGSAFPLLLLVFFPTLRILTPQKWLF